jgi:hypothetical protein
MESKITLYIVARNKTTSNYEILSTNKDDLQCPTADIVVDKTMQEQLYELLKKHIDIENGIINYIFLDIKITNKINIIYFCCVPIDLPIQNSHFLPLNNNYDHIINLQKIINII